jgi:hypothetical protein
VVAFPGVLLLVYGLAVAGTIFHELGHATACHYGGARPGRMGVGLYYVWPVFYTDVTDSYRLDRRGRIRTDLGGVYFNGVFALVLAAVFFRTGFEPLLLVILIQHVQAAQQLVPWLRLDGYYVLTDLVGVPDVLSRLRPILGSLVPGREADPRVEELKPWVRFVVSAYVLITIPALAFAYAFLLVRAPAFFETAVKALPTQLSLVDAGWRAGDLVGVALPAVNAFALIIPLVGVTFVLASTAARVARLLLSRLAPVPAFRTSASFAAGVAVAALLFAGFTGARIVTASGDDAQRPVARVKPQRPAEPRSHPRRPRVHAPHSGGTTVARYRPLPVTPHRVARPAPPPAATAAEDIPFVPETLPPETETTPPTTDATTTAGTTITTSTTTTTTPEGNVP